MRTLRTPRSAARPDYIVVGVTVLAIAIVVVLILLLPGPALKVAGGIAGAVASAGARTLAKRLSMEWTAKRYRDFAERDPMNLFYVRPPIDEPALESRPRLMTAVTAELETQGRDHQDLTPILVVGEAGSGKTTFAAGLARRVAKTHRIPVVISLRKKGDTIDFEAEARKRFEEIVERRRLGPVGDGLWAHLRNSGRCVVIADGLDERVSDSGAGNVTEATDEILSAEPARSIPLVVTSRPDGLRDTQLMEALWLGDLPEGYVASMLVDACRSELGEREAREITRQLGLTSRPLFLTVARDVGNSADGLIAATTVEGSGRPGLLTSIAKTNDTDLARHRLLEARIDIFISGDPGVRRRAVDTVSVLALIAECKGESAASLTSQDDLGESWLREAAGPPLNRSHAIGAAADLRFLRIDGDTVGFRHPIIQAYLAARALALVRLWGAGDPEWSALLNAGTTDEVLRALRMYAMRLALIDDTPEGRSRIAELAQELTTRAAAPAITGNQRLALLATAAHALGSAGAQDPRTLSSERADLARLIAQEWDPECPLATKVEAITWLARMSGGAALLSTWTIAVRDDSYAFRWAAVEAMAESGAAATEALLEIVEPMLEKCRSRVGERDATDGDSAADLLRQLSIVAKFLPSGNEAGAVTAGAGLESPAAADLTAKLAQAVHEMTGRDRALGVEASLAQGLKHAARRYPLTDANLREAEQLAASARFWYTRIMALHALVRHAIATVDTRREDPLSHDTMDRIERRITVALDDEHAWVREAAVQGRAALARLREGHPDDARSFVWHDEARQVSRSSHELDDATSRLLGDVVLVLNMNEQGQHLVPVDGRLIPHPSDSAPVRECEKCRHQLEVGTSNALPYCLSEDGDRHRIVDGERGCSCSFGLCPYDFGAYHEMRHAHRGQLSPQFCAQQRIIAQQLGAPPWQRDMSVSSYVEFWEAMERNGRERRAPDWTATYSDTR